MKVPSALLTSSGLRQMTSLSSVSHSSVVMGPAVRLLIHHFDISEKDIKPSGPKGNILKSDVLKFIELGNVKPVPAKIEAFGVDEVLQAVSQPSLMAKPGQK